MQAYATFRDVDVGTTPIESRIGSPEHRETEEVSVSIDSYDGTVETIVCNPVGEKAVPVLRSSSTTSVAAQPLHSGDAQPTVPSTVPPLIKFLLADFLNFKQCCWKVHVALLYWK